MYLFDPIEGGVIRSVIATVSVALGASFAVIGVADEAWAKIALIVLAALVGIVQTVTHGSAYGNVEIGDLP